MNYSKPPIGIHIHRVDDNYNTNPRILGIIAMFAFGIATGFGIAMLAFAYGF
jgi:hypothetical protein